MDHVEARELLELAAVEHGGLDRLMAGDTPDAAALAGHLAGCPDCTAAMARLRRDAAVIAGVVRSTPPASLRERTLSYVAQVGRDRSAEGTARQPGGASESDRRRESRPFGRRAAAVAALAAVLIAAVAGTSVVLTARDQEQVIAALSRVTTWTLRVEAEPDARRVELAGAPGTTASGTILFSPSSRELVVVATGLSEPSGGREFRCWMEIDGRREPVGKMFFGGDLSYWAGSVETLDAAGSSARFGVTLVDASGSSVQGDPVLSGELGEG
jgi:Anti-sigma-K factor rskA